MLWPPSQVAPQLATDSHSVSNLQEGAKIIAPISQKSKLSHPEDNLDRLSKINIHPTLKHFSRKTAPPLLSPLLLHRIFCSTFNCGNSSASMLWTIYCQKGETLTASTSVWVHFSCHNRKRKKRRRKKER